MLHSPRIVQSMIARRPDAETPAAPQQPTTSPFADPAEPILRSHGIDVDTAAGVWDIFHAARTSKQLIEQLQPLKIPDAVKHELVIAKQKTDPKPGWRDRVERAVQVVKTVAALPREHVETSERHPKVLAAVMKIIGVGHKGNEE